jgi:hypothetical protein
MSEKIAPLEIPKEIKPEIPKEIVEAPRQPALEAIENSPDPPPPRVSYYQEIALSPSVEDPRQLIFIATPGTGKAPQELLKLREDYASTARVVNILFETAKDTRKELFHMLHQAGDRGLRGPEFNIEDGRANLLEVQTAITDQAIKVRDQRLSQYTKLAIVFGVVPLLIGAALFFTDGLGHFPARPSADAAYDPIVIWTLAVFWIPAGAAICVWAEFALRMQSGLTYDQLLNLDPSRWRPGQRLTITVGISFIFAFLLAFNAIQIGVASLLLNDFATKTPALALAVGGITGLAFVAVRDIIFRIKPTERGQA